MFFAFSKVSFAQNKAVVLENVWNNDLNNYNPKEYIDKLYEVLKAKLQVKDFIADVRTLTSTKKDRNWDKNVIEQLKAKKAAGENAYFIAIASELRLPAFNLGKFLFKKPPRSSKLTFTLHVFDTTGTEIIGDTIVNRGCLVRTFDEEKGSKFFYTDYDNFMSDMQCHLDVLRKSIQDKPLAKKQKRYLETK
ncbi:hypothetical protein SAE01_04080 [Segetibacter aerophilus]|uniref:Uncharacterized protein n=2 Tax=Segetibacter aerophilus TaxID=670293 RepID=A0A512B7G8_9BACT|nr:hypothetical protein SAE01_04080 [Segetibacter aerophilus]